MPETPLSYIAEKDNPPKEYFFPKNIPFISVIQLFFKVFGVIFPKMSGKLALSLFSSPFVKPKHKKQDDLLKSVKTFFLDRGDIKIAGYSWGESDKVVLLVHGWASRGTALRSFVPRLLEEGYMVVAMDGPAHGDSGGKGTHISDFSSAQKLFHDKFNIVGIITHSFGGVTSHFIYHEWLTNEKLPPIVMISLPRNLVEIFPDVQEMFQLPPKCYQSLLDLVKKRGGRELEEFSLENIMKLSNKVMIIQDIDDNIVPYQRPLNIKKQYPSVEVKLTKGFGHFYLVKNENVINTAVKFLVDNQFA